MFERFQQVLIAKYLQETVLVLPFDNITLLNVKLQKAAQI